MGNTRGIEQACRAMHAGFKVEIYRGAVIEQVCVTEEVIVKQRISNAICS